MAAMAVGSVGFSVHKASATVVYNDTFGTATGTTRDLNGSTPTIDSTGATWTSPAGDITTGNGAATVVTTTAAGQGYTAYLPLTLAANTIYTLSTTITPNTTAANPTDWLAAGFGTTGTASTAPAYTNGEAWLLYRANGGTQSFYGGGANNGKNGGTAPGPQTFSVTLNTATGAVAFGGLLAGNTGTLTPAEVAATNTVFIGQLATATGTFQNFNLSSAPASAVPEPATLAIAGVGAAGLLLRRKRKLA